MNAQAGRHLYRIAENTTWGTWTIQYGEDRGTRGVYWFENLQGGWGSRDEAETIAQQRITVLAQQDDAAEPARAARAAAAARYDADDAWFLSGEER